MQVGSLGGLLPDPITDLAFCMWKTNYGKFGFKKLAVFHVFFSGCCFPSCILYLKSLQKDTSFGESSRPKNSPCPFASHFPSLMTALRLGATAAGLFFSTFEERRKKTNSTTCGGSRLLRLREGCNTFFSTEYGGWLSCEEVRRRGLDDDDDDDDDDDNDGWWMMRMMDDGWWMMRMMDDGWWGWWMMDDEDDGWWVMKETLGLRESLTTIYNCWLKTSKHP